MAVAVGDEVADVSVDITLDQEVKPGTTPQLSYLLSGAGRIEQLIARRPLAMVDRGHHGDVGADLSVAIGADGLPLISYYNATGQNLKVAHCNDVACSSATTPTLDSDGDVGQHTSIAIGSDGLGLISYYDATNSALKVAHCDNTACSSATITTLENANDVGTDTSIAIGVDGFGLISFRDDSSLNLRVAHCDPWRVDLTAGDAARFPRWHAAWNW